MNWDAIGAVGEILGAIAVLATLIYLSIQIRQSSTQTKMATYESFVSGFSDVDNMLGNNKEAAMTFHIGLSDPDSLGDAEEHQFYWMMRSFTVQYFKLYRLYQQGIIPEEDWIGNAREAAGLLGTEGGKRFRASMGDSFKDFFDVFREYAPEDGSETYLTGASSPLHCRT